MARSGKRGGDGPQCGMRLPIKSGVTSCPAPIGHPSTSTACPPPPAPIPCRWRRRPKPTANSSNNTHMLKIGDPMPHFEVVDLLLPPHLRPFHRDAPGLRRLGRKEDVREDDAGHPPPHLHLLREWCFGAHY